MIHPQQSAPWELTALRGSRVQCAQLLLVRSLVLSMHGAHARPRVTRSRCNDQQHPLLKC